MSASSLTRELFRFSPAPAPRLGIALRAGLALGLPLGLLTLLGQQHLGLQICAGAFTALYAGNMHARERAKALPFVAAGIVLSAVLGVICVVTGWSFALGLCAVTVVAGALCFAFHLGPPGPLFFVLTYGLAGNVTAVHDGVRANSPVVFIGAVVLGALTAYLLAVAPALRRRPTRARTLRELLPGPALNRSGQEMLLRISVVAVVGTILTHLFLDPHFAYWTVASGVGVVGVAAGRRFAFLRGVHRVAGTVLGAGLFLALLPLAHWPWVLVCVLALLQFTSELLVVRNYALALVFVTPLVLFITTTALAATTPWTSVEERVLDTLVGSLVAMLTGLLHRRPARPLPVARLAT